MDRKYARVTPTVSDKTLASTDNLVRTLELEIRTGGDDLRGGNDNINVTVRLKDGSTMVFNNINKGKR